MTAGDELQAATSPVYSTSRGLATRTPNRLHPHLKETTGGEFRVYRASIRLLKVYRPSIRLQNGNYPPENVLDRTLDHAGA